MADGLRVMAGWFWNLSDLELDFVVIRSRQHVAIAARNKRTLQILAAYNFGIINSCSEGTTGSLSGLVASPLLGLSACE